MALDRPGTGSDRLLIFLDSVEDETYETITKRGVEFCRSDPKQIQEILLKLI